MKVLIADKFPENHIQNLKNQGIEVVYEPKTGENDMPSKVEGINVIVVRSTNVNASTIESGKDLKLIIRAGSGYNNIDVKTASANGVAVANTPGKNSIAVAELAMGLILAIDRRIPDNVKDFSNGVWNKGEFSKAEGLFGKTIGIVGLGNIGKELAVRAQAFGMKVIGYDIVEVNIAGVEFTPDLENLVQKADILSLHLPATDKTKGLFNSKMFDLMKKNAILINTSRDKVINEDDLLKAIEEKNIFAGLDVFNGEPEDKAGPVSSKLQNNKNIYVTHHIGASTEQAQDAVAEETIKIITTYTSTGEILHKVN